MRRVLPLLTVLALVGCKNEPKLEARLEAGDAGASIVVLKTKEGKELRAAVAGAEPGPVDTDGARAAVRVDGGHKVVHVVGDRALVAPKATRDWRAATFESEAGDLFVAYPEAREAILARARAEGGDDAVARAIADAADLRGAPWDDAYGKLSDAAKKKVDARLRKALDVGEKPVGLLRAATTVDLAAADLSPKLGARVAELGATKTPISPRALGILLRVYARDHKDDAGAVGCKILGAGPVEPAAGTGDSAGVRPLVDAALLAIAHGRTACKDPLLKVAGQDRCAILFRCKPGGGRLAPNEASDQKEPLCTREMLEPDVHAELARTPASLATGEEYWTDRFGLAALWATDAVPPEWARGHERRRYELKQPASPECGVDLKQGTPCRCDEPTLRDQACRNDASPIQAGFCHFEVDDKKKLISNVTYQSM